MHPIIGKHHAAILPLNHPRPNLRQHIRVPVQHLEQLDQRQRRLGFAILIAREGIGPVAERGGSFLLVEVAPRR